MTADALLGLIRPFTLLAPPVGVVCGALVCNGSIGVPWRWSPVLFGILSAVLATAASNAWNQAFDVELDRVNKPHRPVPSGRASVKQARNLGHALALCALVAGVFSSPGFLACVGVGILATWVYSAPPLRTKRHPLASNLTIAVPRGLLVPVAGWATLAPPTDREPWVLGLVTGLYVLGAAGTKDFADIEGDRAHGCRTLPVLLGPRRAAHLIAPFLVLPFLLYPLAGELGWLRAPVDRLWILGGVLATVGLGAAVMLLRDPTSLAQKSGNHPAWAAMYLLMLGASIGTALVYQL